MCSETRTAGSIYDLAQMSFLKRVSASGIGKGRRREESNPSPPISTKTREPSTLQACEVQCAPMQNIRHRKIGSLNHERGRFAGLSYLNVDYNSEVEKIDPHISVSWLVLTDFDSNIIPRQFLYLLSITTFGDFASSRACLYLHL